jgi:ferric-chelate reductase
VQYLCIGCKFSSPRPPVSVMNYQIASATDCHTRRNLAYYDVCLTMILWGLDGFIRLVRLATLNFGYLNPWSSQNSKNKLDAVVEVLSPRFIRVSFRRSRHFHWRPGQIAYLSFPSISTLPFETHPFTISTIDTDEYSESSDSTLVFLVRVQRGFTQKLLKEASSDTTYKVFLNGPYGSPPILMGYQTVMLIAGSFLLSLHLAVLIIHMP